MNHEGPLEREGRKTFHLSDDNVRKNKHQPTFLKSGETSSLELHRVGMRMWFSLNPSTLDSRRSGTQSQGSRRSAVGYAQNERKREPKSH